jgi:hypothetical protein
LFFSFAAGIGASVTNNNTGARKQFTSGCSWLTDSDVTLLFSFVQIVNMLSNAFFILLSLLSFADPATAVAVP